MTSKWLYSVYTWNCNFCYRPGYQQRVCSWPVTDLDHKVRACAIAYCISETLVQQICMIYAVVSDSGLH
jgi:hypothetical protein